MCLYEPCCVYRSACPRDKPILEVTGKTMEALVAIKSALAKHYEVGNIWECVEKTLGEGNVRFNEVNLYL